MSMCYITQADYDRYFATDSDVEPRATCRDCGADIATAFDRCDDCEERHQETIDQDVTEPRFV